MAVYLYVILLYFIYVLHFHICELVSFCFFDVLYYDDMHIQIVIKSNVVDRLLMHISIHINHSLHLFHTLAH